MLSTAEVSSLSMHAVLRQPLEAVKTHPLTLLFLSSNIQNLAVELLIQQSKGLFIVSLLIINKFVLTNANNMEHHNVLKLGIAKAIIFVTYMQTTVHTQHVRVIMLIYTNESIHATIQKYGKEDWAVLMLSPAIVANLSWNVMLSVTATTCVKSLYFKTTTAGLFLTLAVRIGL